MKLMNILLVLALSIFMVACDGGTTSETDQNTSTNDMSAQEQAELVAAALSSDQGGVGDDISIISQAANDNPQQQALRANATYGYSVNVTIDFYDAQDTLQEAYDPDTTDQIDYESVIQGEITNGAGYFSELSIDNRSNFTVDDILSRTAWINGTHTNHSSYQRTAPLTQAQVNFQLECELIVTDITIDLDAEDTFPESGTIEGTLSGSYERIDGFGQHTHQFNFQFLATYLGDNTAEIELADGRVYIVRLESGSVEESE